jgi:ethanolamine utilization protein EutN
MKFARVIGTVVATRKAEGLEGVKLLVVQPLDERRQPRGEPQIAADATAQAGHGELVFVVGSREAAQALPIVFVPADLAITGIIDEIDDRAEFRDREPTASWSSGNGSGTLRYHPERNKGQAQGASKGREARAAL